MIRNFLFHRVNPQRDKLWDPMDVVLFDKCIKYISSNYEVMLIEDLVFSEKLKSKNKIATIMFDDGYKDNIEIAAPILDKYNCKASFYVVTDCIDYNIPTWTHVLEHTFQFTDTIEFNIEFAFIPKELHVETLSNLEERLNYIKKLKPFLKTVTHNQRNEVLEFIAKKCSDIILPQLMMNWEDLKSLKSRGHYIGSHTITHCMLGTIEDESLVRKELITSGNKIKEQLGYFPITISYPVGSFNQTTKRIASEVGYQIGLAVKQNIYNPSKDDLFEISRIELYNEPWWKTRLRISNTLENIKSFIGYK
jgi:peptidoglycan/xylan/chitin deacetylase (PgdA/CDA1 family)